MSILELAEKLRGRPLLRRDPILRAGAEIFDAEDAIREINSRISSLTLFDVDEDGNPKATGFANPDLVEDLVEERGRLTEEKAYYLGICRELERIFEEAKEPVRGMEALQGEITVLGNLVYDVSCKINRLVLEFITHKPGISLAEIWGNPEIQALEAAKAEASRHVEKDRDKLISLLDALMTVAMPAFQRAEESRLGRHVSSGVTMSELGAEAMALPPEEVIF